MDVKMADAIALQVVRELQSAQIYRQMHYHCDYLMYPGFGHWFALQTVEETAHADRLAEFLTDLDVEIRLQALESTGNVPCDLVQMVQMAYEHEKQVTAWIEELATLASSLNDHLTYNMLKWFLTEQVEELAQSQQLFTDVYRSASDAAALVVLDREAATRT